MVKGVCKMFKGDRLKLLREEKNMTQLELGKVFSISHATINRYENSQRQPDTELISKLSEFFNVTTDYLLGRNDVRNNTESISEAIKDDQDLFNFWETLKDRPDLQLLFKQTKNLTNKDIKQILKIIKTFEDEEDSND